MSLSTDMATRMTIAADHGPIGQTRRYDAYGTGAAGEDAARTGFSGQVCEATLPWYLLGSRFYVPELRTFISPDGASPFNAGGLNRYAYCAGDPINRVDPDGHAWSDWLVMGLGLVGAAIATVASAGALAGAAAAAGGLAAAFSGATTATTALTAAVVLDLVSVVAEVGSVMSMAVDNESAGGIFGWVALGTAVGSGAMALFSKRIAKAGSLAQTRRGSSASLTERVLAPPAPDRTVRKTGYVRDVYSFGPGNKSRISVYQGPAALAEASPPRQISGGRVVPQWHVKRNAAGGFVHVADTDLNTREGWERVRVIAGRNDGLPVRLLVGGHGDVSGLNFEDGRRLYAEERFFELSNDKRLEVAARAGLPSDRLHVVNIAYMSLSAFLSELRQAAHVVLLFCYSAADRAFMTNFNIPRIRLYKN